MTAPNKTEHDDLERVAMNIVYQIGDLFSDFGDRATRDAVVEIRQATNDKAIDFVRKLLASTEDKARINEVNLWIDTWYQHSQQHTTARYGIGVKRLKKRVAELRTRLTPRI